MSSSTVNTISTDPLKEQHTSPSWTQPPIFSIVQETCWVVLAAATPGGTVQELGVEEQHVWDAGTTKLLAKKYVDAAGERKRRGVQYFEQDINSGIPVLTAAGRKAVEEELRECSEASSSS
ncbi:hypothetical protein EDB19DRAFT_1831631 [Suillus lakei]|nr:hypothetical protein EDB19DRAFT_1831631 [Suillus lakei]